MTSKPILLFDLGGVLVEASGRAALRELAPAEMSEAAILAKWHASKAVLAFETGQITADRFSQDFVRDWGLSTSPQAFLDSFRGWVKGFYPGALEMLALLKKRHRLACLSNTNEIHWSRLSQAPAYFEQCILSFETGWMKPQVHAYEAAAQALAAEYSTIWFFDDLEANIEAARALGMQAVRVSGLEETRAVLRQQGYLDA